MMNSAMALKVPYGLKLKQQELDELDEIEQKPFVPEPIEDGGKKLALALGGLAVINLTTLLMAHEFDVDKSKYQNLKTQKAIKDEYLEDEKELDKIDFDDDENLDYAFDDEITEAQIQNEISKNIFQNAAHSVTKNVKKYERIANSASNPAAHGFFAMKAKAYNPFF